MLNLIRSTTLFAAVTMLGAVSQAVANDDTYTITCQPGGKMTIDYSLWSGHNNEKSPSSSTAVIKFYSVVSDESKLVPGSCTWNKDDFGGDGTVMTHFNIRDARFMVKGNNQVTLLSLGKEGNQYLRPFQNNQRFTVTAKKNTGRSFHVLAF